MCRMEKQTICFLARCLKKYNAMKPYGKIADFKKTIARIIGGTEEDAIDHLNDLLETVLPLRPLHEYGFPKEDIELFTDSVILNEQRSCDQFLMSASTRELIVEICTELY